MVDLDSSEEARPGRCGACSGGLAPPFPFSMAFQPIVDLARKRIYAYEALVRGPQGEPAATVLDQITLANRYAFDQSCRIKAIEMASRLGLGRTGASLSINFIPGAMYEPENCVRATLAATRRTGLPVDQLVFELTENEQVRDVPHLERIFSTYRRHHMRVALDDFGAGFSGLGLLAHFQPDVVKIDMSLLRGLDSDSRRHAIIQGMVGICRDLGTDIVAEGVESHAEQSALCDLGITLFQGYLFARPGFEHLPEVAFA